MSIEFRKRLVDEEGFTETKTNAIIHYVRDRGQGTERVYVYDTPNSNFVVDYENGRRHYLESFDANSKPQAKSGQCLLKILFPSSL